MSSAVRRAAVACTQGAIVTQNGSCSARLSFPPNFIGFQGHFPGNPILPGVCLVEAVLGLLESAYGKPLRLRRISSAKFLEPVKPGQLIAVDCATSEDAKGLKVNARVTNAGGRVAELLLHVAAA